MLTSVLKVLLRYASYSKNRCEDLLEGLVLFFIPDIIIALFSRKMSSVKDSLLHWSNAALLGVKCTECPKRVCSVCVCVAALEEL